MNEKLVFLFITSCIISILVFSNKLENVILWVQSLFRLNKVVNR